MALGPEKIHESLKRRLEKAEYWVDSIINKKTELEFRLDLKSAAVTLMEWNAHLKPKYEKAGWKSAVATRDVAGNYSIFFSTVSTGVEL
jgi:hypothetical protein